MSGIRPDARAQHLAILNSWLAEDEVLEDLFQFEKWDVLPSPKLLEAWWPEYLESEHADSVNVDAGPGYQGCFYLWEAFAHLDFMMDAQVAAGTGRAIRYTPEQDLPARTTPTYHTNTKGVLHRDGGPAFSSYHPDGSVEYEAWYQDGELHRLDGPAETFYRPDGSVVREAWWQDGLLENGDNPAICEYYPDGNVRRERWLKQGTYYREDGPAEISYNPDGSVEHFLWLNDSQMPTENTEPIGFSNTNKERITL